MERKSGSFAVLFFLIFCAVRLPAQALYWETEMKDPLRGEGTTTMKCYHLPRMFKQVTEAQNEFMIFLLDRQIMIRGNTQQKTYSQITFSEFQRRLKSSSDKGTKNAPSAKPIPKTINILRSGEVKEIIGYQCSEFVVEQNGRKLFSVWTTKNIPGFSTMKKDFDEYLVQTTKLKLGYGEMLAKHIKEVEGFPMKIDYGGATATVTKVEKRAIAKNEFTAPAGYKYLPPKPIPKTSPK